MLRLPDFSKEFVLQTDACNDGIGGILLQEEDGVKHPVAFASKKLLPRECHFSTIAVSYTHLTLPTNREV